MTSRDERIFANRFPVTAFARSGLIQPCQLHRCQRWSWESLSCIPPNFLRARRPLLLSRSAVPKKLLKRSSFVSQRIAGHPNQRNRNVAAGCFVDAESGVASISTKQKNPWNEVSYSIRFIEFTELQSTPENNVASRINKSLDSIVSREELSIVPEPRIGFRRPQCRLLRATSQQLVNAMPVHLTSLSS